MSKRVPVGYRFYWDDHCRLCNTLKRVAVLLDWTNRITFVPLLSLAASVDLGHMSLEDMSASSHLVSPEGRVYSKGQGILELAAQLPLIAPLVFVFRLLPRHEELADKLYALVAQNRGAPYGGSCQVNFDDSKT